MTVPTPDHSLDAIRRDIDSIDGQILSLLARRFAATEKVRLAKAQDGSIAASPFRPAREAVMMRRLIAEAGDSLSADILVRLWRVILSASIQSQAPVTLHMHATMGNDLGVRLAVGQHFCGMAVALHGSPSAAISALSRAQGDLALVVPGSDWADALASSGGAQVIGTLPVLDNGQPPQILILGHAEPQATGDDQTLVVLGAETPEVKGAAWQTHSGVVSVVGLNGFLGRDDLQLASLLAQFPGARIAGRYPRPIKVPS